MQEEEGLRIPGARAGRVPEILAALLLFGLAGVAEPQAPPAPSSGAASAPSAPFSSGERLHYSISWRIFTAGEATIYLEHQSPVWQATIKAESTGFASKLYTVNDTFISRFDDAAMCSQSLVKLVHEGKRHREIRIDFEKNRKMAVLKEIDLAESKLLRQAENPIPECAYDVVSALFHVRTRPLEVGKNFQVNINDGAQTFPITVEVQAREEVKTPAGTFRTIRIEPKVFGGTLLRRSGRMQLWLSDDPQRLLVELKAKLFWGTISAVLARVERK